MSLVTQRRVIALVVSDDISDLGTLFLSEKMKEQMETDGLSRRSTLWVVEDVSLGGRRAAEATKT